MSVFVVSVYVVVIVLCRYYSLWIRMCLNVTNSFVCD